MTSTTWNGTGQTLVGAAYTALGQAEISHWYSVAPATGTLDYVFNRTAGSPAGQAFVVWSFQGVDQTTPHDAIGDATDTTLTPTIAVSSAVDDMVVDFMVIAGTIDAATLAVGAGQISSLLVENGTNDFNWGASRQTGAASVTMSWTYERGAGARSWGTTAFNINAAGAGPACTPMLTLLGVGAC